jgi:hypothetical protein
MRLDITFLVKYNIIACPILSIFFTLCKLYPDSNIIGGRRTRKNAVGDRASSFCG